MQHSSHTPHTHLMPFWHHVYLWFIPHERNDHKPHAIRHTTLASYGLGLIAFKAIMSLALFLSYPNEAAFSSLTSQWIVELTNAKRIEIGISPLQSQELLKKSADMKAQDMAEKGYFAHKSPGGATPWEWFKRVGYEYTYAGENLAMDFSNAEDVVEAWMESPKHRENILNPKYKDIGIAVITGTVNGKTVNLVVQHFGTSYASYTSPSFGVARGESIGATNPAVQGISSVASSRTQVFFSNKKASIISLATHHNIFYAVFALVLGGLLALNLFIMRRKSHHHSMIFLGVFVMALSCLLIFLNTHFIERIGADALIVL